MIWDGRPARVPTTQAGRVSVPFTASQTSAAVAVTFPRAFTAAPVVVAGNQNADLNASAASITATGFIAQAYRPAGAITFIATVHWIARGVA